MPIDILNTVDMNQNETEEFVLDNLAAAPVTPVPGQMYFDTILDIPRTWDGLAWLSAAPAVGAVTKVATDVGDGIALAYVVTHNLGTRDVVVSLFNNTTFDESIATIDHTTINTITVIFALPPLLNAYRVTVIG